MTIRIVSPHTKKFGNDNFKKIYSCKPTTYEPIEGISKLWLEENHNKYSIFDLARHLKIYPEGITRIIMELLNIEGEALFNRKEIRLIGAVLYEMNKEYRLFFRKQYPSEYYIEVLAPYKLDQMYKKIDELEGKCLQLLFLIKQIYDAPLYSSIIDREMAIHFAAIRLNIFKIEHHISCSPINEVEKELLELSKELSLKEIRENIKRKYEDAVKDLLKKYEAL